MREQDGVFQNINSLKPNTTYKVSVFIKSENNEAGLMKVRFYGGEDINRRYSKSTYGQVSTTFKTGPENTSVRIALLKYVAGATGKTWFDNLSLTEVGGNEISANGNGNLQVKNLLNNSGFENGIKGWSKGKGCEISSVNNNSRSGNNALMFSGTKCGVFQKISN